MTKRKTYKEYFSESAPPSRGDYSVWGGVKVENYTVRDLARLSVSDKHFQCDYVKSFKLKSSYRKDRFKVAQRFAESFYLTFIEHVFKDVVTNGHIFQFADRDCWLEACEIVMDSKPSFGAVKINYKYRGKDFKLKVAREVREYPHTVVMMKPKYWWTLQRNAKAHKYRQIKERDLNQWLKRERIKSLKKQANAAKL